ncbi:hypothetical protein D3C84_1136250 [compost metagenome]
MVFPIFYRRRARWPSVTVRVLLRQIGGKPRYMGLDRAQQFFLAERLGQKLIGTDNPPLGLVEQTVLGRQHNHWRGLERTVVLD